MVKAKKGKLYIGTSGIALPGSKEDFPAAFRSKTRLAYYASLFNSLEINSTFKKMPRPSTFENWCAEVPHDFTFTIKLAKDFTHTKKQEIARSELATFINALDAVGQKRGCLLVQFPASITIALQPQVQQLLQTFHAVDSKNSWRKAVEFRSPTWYNNATFNVLRKYKATLVLQDMPKSNNLHLQENFPFYYFRYHGPKGDYRGSYEEPFLQQQAATMKHLLEQGKDVYAYFNNTMGNAFENAMFVQQLLQ